VVSTLPGAASTAVRDLLAPGRRGRVVAVFPTCVYVELEGRLVALEAAGGLRLPCAVLLGVGPAARPLAGVRVADVASTGPGGLRVGPLTVRVARWWAPAAPRGAKALQPAPAAPGLTAAVLDLLGRGPGLTPAGDDLLAGLLVGLAGRPDLRDPMAAAVLAAAPRRTTWLSAELLAHAAHGRAAPVVVAVADALAGDGDDDALPRALPALLAVGHTSGAALARGLLLAADTVARHPMTRDEAA
jgi:hypothetical protein